MIKTGIKEIDNFWNIGLQGGGLILIAARPGMGKTSFLLSLGKLISQRHKTLLISLEHSVEHLKRKNLKRKNIVDSMLIDDSPELDTELLTKKISQINPEVVLIDYVQLIMSNRETLLQDLKKIAIKANICMIVSSQINRDPEYRALSERRPILNDLTKNGTLFNLKNLSYIDQLTFLYRDHYYNRLLQKPDVIELIKYDNGNKNTVNLNWNSLN